MQITKFNIYMEEFTAYTVERIKGKKNNLVFNISCDVSLTHILPLLPFSMYYLIT